MNPTVTGKINTSNFQFVTLLYACMLWKGPNPLRKSINEQSTLMHRRKKKIGKQNKYKYLRKNRQGISYVADSFVYYKILFPNLLRKNVV